MFNASDGAEAQERIGKLVEKYRRPAPKLADWIETNLPEGLAVFALPEAHRRRIRADLTVQLEHVREMERRGELVFPSLPARPKAITSSSSPRDPQ